MTAPEYRAALQALNMSQMDAARLFDVDPRTSRRWALGEKPVPRTAALCLRLMVSYSVSPAEALVLATAE